MAEASRADTEPILGPDVDAVLVLVTRIVRGAVSRFRNAEVSTSLKVGWASAVVVVEAD